MGKNKSKILPMILSVLVLSMLISPSYPTLNNAYAAPAETPTLDVKCAAEVNSNKPVSPDCQLLNLLEEEVAARIAADLVLQQNIDDEEAARIAADLVLQQNIDDEEAARIAADNNLQNLIDALETNAEDAFDEIILYLTGVEILAAAAGVACALTAEPSCAVAFGALAVAAAASILVLEAIDFTS